MKPNFALTLSFEGIGLLHRAFPGWHLVGDVALNGSDLNSELAELRKKAGLLDPAGLQSKLVLPDDQIKYLVLSDIDSENADLEDVARSALDGATPYAVDELAFDWVMHDGQMMIAAVARETLAEAEAFAVDHAFNPVSFVAAPEDGRYVGEPFFGLTKWAKANSVSGSDIERDTAPVRIIGAAKLPDPEPQTETKQSAEEIPTQDKPDTTQEEKTEGQAHPVPVAVDNDTTPAASATEAKPNGETADQPKGETEDVTPEVATAFASIRARRDDGTPATPRLEGVVREKVAPRITLGTAAPPETPDNPLPITGIADGTLPEDESAEAGPALLPDEHARLTQPDVAVPQPEEAKPSFFTRRSQRKSKSDAPTAPISRPQDEKQRMTIFGAREQAEIGGKPRFLGLILTAVLLLFLIGIAAWASIFMDEGVARFFRSDAPPVVAELPEAEAPSVDVEPEPEIDLASLQPSEPVSVLDDPATEILSRVNPEDLSPDEAKARYAATGIWQLAPEPSETPQPSEMEEFYQTSLDPSPDFQDAVALPVAGASDTDVTMFSLPSPPASETRFIFDNRGFVLATPDGALTPDGVQIFAGRPTVIPPLRGALDTSTVAEAEATEPQPQLAGIRPRARPDDVAEKIERNELSGRTRSELASLRPKLRPQSAQEAAEAVQKAQAEADAAVQAAAVDAEAVDNAVAAAAQATIAFSTATPQAVSTSLKPRPKPSNFDRIVKRAQRNQANQNADEGGEAVAVLASQRVSPKIPTKASVSKQATQRNALKFKRVNLIGVYGTPNSRRALVRMSNGRYKKVKVGDRLDGGRVSAIGTSDLRYTKGGRTVILKMPRG